MWSARRSPRLPPRRSPTGSWSSATTVRRTARVEWSRRFWREIPRSRRCWSAIRSIAACPRSHATRLSLMRGASTCWRSTPTTSSTPDCLERLVKALEAEPDAAFAYGILEQFDGSGPVGLSGYFGWEPERLVRDNYIDALALMRRWTARASSTATARTGASSAGRTTTCGCGSPNGVAAPRTSPRFSPGTDCPRVDPVAHATSPPARPAERSPSTARRCSRGSIWTSWTRRRRAARERVATPPR